MDGLSDEDHEDLARGVDVIATARAREAVRELAPKLVRDELAPVVARMDMERRSEQARLDMLLRDSGRFEPWRPRDFLTGDYTTHNGGVWRCIAARGARPDDEPGPDSAVWISASRGVKSISVTKVAERAARLTIELSDGETVSTSVSLPGFKMKGPYDSQRPYFTDDLVSRDGGSFVALKDDPGPCPGPGWQMLSQRGKPGAVTPDQMRKLLDHLENRANARSVRERLTDSFSAAIEELRQAHPHRERQENEYRSFAHRLAGVMTMQVAETLYPGGLAGREEAVLRCAASAEQVVMMAFQNGHNAGKPTDRLDLDTRAALVTAFEGYVLETLVEAVPALIGSPSRRKQAAVWARGARTLVQRGWEGEALRPLVQAAAFVPRTETSFMNSSDEANREMARMTCLPFLELLSDDEDDEELAA